MNTLKKLTNKLVTPIDGILIKDNKMVATNKWALIEKQLKGETLKDLNVIIAAQGFKAGDKLNADKTVTRKDGSTYQPAILPGDDFPTYTNLFPAKKDFGEYNTAKINKKYLIDLLNATDEQEVNISILDTNSALILTSETSRSLLMPISN